MLRLLFALSITAFILVNGCSDTHESPGNQASSDAGHEVEIAVLVPEGTPTVYVTGNLPTLGPWQPDGQALEGTGTRRTVTLQAPAGYDFEYKFTLGTWFREALDASGSAPPNYTLRVDDDAKVEHEIEAFKVDPIVYMEDGEGAGVLGRLVNWTDVSSAFLSETRHVQVWLPPAYDENPTQRFRVLYMHDGQNLFDPRLSGMGVDWGVDEAIMRGVNAGLFDPVIVVAAWNSSRRFAEYSPWHEAPQYARFLIEEMMPRINAEFRTLTGPENTFVMGSSMGGLLSYYLVKEHPDTFHACGCVSTHFPLSEAVAASILGDDAPTADTTAYIIKDIAAGHTIPEDTRYFFDYGTEGLDASYGPPHDAVQVWLTGLGLEEGSDFMIREYEGADHNEASWRARLEDQLVWMLADAGK